jgi:hypothetical protein
MTEFSHKTYSELLQFIRSLGRSIVSFRDVPPEGPYVILRHDVDFSLQYAVEMAHLDRENGATATFFILLTAPYYNPLSEQGICAIREISAMGHECGLHYDCTGFELLSPEQRIRRIEALACTLADLSGMPIRAIAQHKPARSPIRQEFPGFVDAYSAKFINDIAYISDSRMMFRVPDVRDFFRKHPKSQALIHPIWWRPSPLTRAEVFKALKSDMTASDAELLRIEEESIAQFLATHATSSP